MRHRLITKPADDVLTGTGRATYLRTTRIAWPNWPRQQPRSTLQHVVLLASGLLCWFSSLEAFAKPRVQITAPSRIQVHTEGSRKSLKVAATLTDELARPLAAMRLRILLLDAAGGTIAWDSRRPCALAESSESGTRRHLLTNRDGMVCLVGTPSATPRRVRVEFLGYQLYGPTSAEVPWIDRSSSLDVGFSPVPRRINLDNAHVELHARAQRAKDEGVPDLPVELLEHDGRRLAVALSDRDGHVTFRVPTADIDGPSIARLSLSVDKHSVHPTSSASVLVARQAIVTLETSHRSTTGDLTRGVDIPVRVRTQRGNVTQGLVEARVGKRVLAIAPVVDGVATLRVVVEPDDLDNETAFAFGDTTHLSASLHYVPSQSVYVASNALAINLIHKRSLGLLPILQLVVVVLLGAWLLENWLRPKRRRTKRRQLSAESTHGSVQVVSPQPRAKQWQGTVIDAHDATAIPNATLSVVSASFAGNTVLLTSRSAQDGSFHFYLDAPAPTLRLCVKAPNHVTLTSTFPAAGLLCIKMVSRRRALLEQLVRWTQRQHKRWTQQPEATPHHVIEVAHAAKLDRIESWASSVQQSVYDKPALDEVTQQAIDKMHDEIQPAR